VPFIKPRARGKYLHKMLAQLDDQNYETLYAYATFIDESTDYVINELIDAVLARNKRFRLWREEHPHSCTPRAKMQARDTARRDRTPVTPPPRVSDAPATSRGSTV
jgi:hypothetical protein